MHEQNYFGLDLSPYGTQQEMMNRKILILFIFYLNQMSNLEFVFNQTYIASPYGTS